MGNKIVITESQFIGLSDRKLLTEVNIMTIINKMRTYHLPKYKEFILKNNRSNNENSISLYLSQTGEDTNFKVRMLKDLINEFPR